jgi:PST family polysaccharide transporter
VTASHDTSAAPAIPIDTDVSRSRFGERLRSRAGINVGALTLERSVQLLNGLLVTSFIARRLGPENWAAIAWCLALCAVFFPLAAAIQPMLLKQLIERPERGAAAWSTATLISGLVCVPLTGIAFVCLALMGGPAQDAAWGSAVLLGVLFVRPLVLAEAYFQARLLMDRAVAFRLTVTVGASLLKLVTVLLTDNVNLLLLVYAVEQVVGVIGLAWLARAHSRKRVQGRARPCIDKTLTRSWAKLLVPTMLATLSVSVYMRVDQLMLAHFVAHETLGRYAVAVLFAEAPFFLATAVMCALVPRLTTTFDQGRGEDAYLRHLELVTGVMVALGVVVAVGMTVAGPITVKLLLGEQYAAAGPYVQVLAWSAPFVFLGAVQASVTVLYSQQSIALIRLLAAGALNVGANLALLPLYGAMAAAVTTVASQAVAAWLGNFLHPATRSIARQQSKALLGVPLWRHAHRLRLCGAKAS